MIKITKRAIEKVKEIATEEGFENCSLRLRVIGGGCSGFNYDLAFESDIGIMDEEFEQGGVKMCVDPLSHQYLDGTELDYIDGVYGSGFKFLNPNITGTCGCGSSFSI